MEESRLVDSTEAARLLGVKPASLYAYVSRGLLRSHRRDGSRTSWFDPAELRNWSPAGGGPAGRARRHHRIALTSIRTPSCATAAATPSPWPAGPPSRRSASCCGSTSSATTRSAPPRRRWPPSAAGGAGGTGGGGSTGWRWPWRRRDRRPAALRSVPAVGRALRACPHRRHGRQPPSGPAPVAVLEVGGRRRPGSMAARLWGRWPTRPRRSTTVTPASGPQRRAGPLRRPRAGGLDAGGPGGGVDPCGSLCGGVGCSRCLPGPLARDGQRRGRGPVREASTPAGPPRPSPNGFVKAGSSRASGTRSTPPAIPGPGPCWPSSVKG